MEVQTNRTILFEKVNSEKENILSLIQLEDRKESLSDQEIYSMHRELVVNDFDGFMKTFSPAVYMLLDVDRRTVSFSREYVDSKQIRVPLGMDKSIFWQIQEMIDCKRRRVYSFKEFSETGNKLLTNKDPFEFDLARNQILEYLAEGSGAYNKAKQELVRLIGKNNDNFYLLLVYIHDVERFCLGQHQNNINRGIIKDNGKLQVRVVETAVSYKNGLIQYPDTVLERYTRLIEEVGVAPGIMRDILTLPCILSEDKRYELFSKYDAYLALYTAAIKSFWNCSKPLLETMFGVYEFFEQQRGASKNADLVVANMSVDEILDARNKEKLDIYLRSVNSKVFYENTIWYAIVPNLDLDSRKKTREIRTHFASSASEEYEFKRYEKEEVISLMELLSEYKIQTFASFGTGQNVTFSRIVEGGLEEIGNLLLNYERIENKDFFVPCYPNFVLVSDSESYIRLGKRILYDEMTEKLEVKGNNDIWLNNVEVEASYIAAGMFAACQDVQYLSSSFRRGVKENNPGVGYRFSEKDNRTHTISDMLSETYEFKSEIVEEILLRSKGVVFAQEDGRMQILTDRVFSFSHEKKLLVSMVQTITYIERTLQKETQDFKKNLILQFFQKRPGSIYAEWSQEDQNCINPILRQGEELSYELKDKENVCEFMVDFGNSRLTRKNKVFLLDE